MERKPAPPASFQLKVKTMLPMMFTSIPGHTQGRQLARPSTRGFGGGRWESTVPTITMEVKRLIPFVNLPAVRHVFSLPEFVNSTCVFPFLYGDISHYNCISIHSNYDWCSLDKKFQGRWRYCTGKGKDPSDGPSQMPRIQEAIDSSWLHDFQCWINLSPNPDFSTCFNHFENSLVL